MSPIKKRPLRHAIAGAAIALATAAASPCEGATTGVVVTEADVQAVTRQLSPIYTDDEPVRVIDAGAYRVGVFVVGRPKPRTAQPISADGATAVIEGLVLPNVTAIVRILKGSGDFVTGGTLVDEKPIAADDPDLAVIGPGFRGKAISHGVSRRVRQGDLVIVPAGTPHGFSAIYTPLVYEVIRIDSAKTLPLK